MANRRLCQAPGQGEFILFPERGPETYVWQQYPVQDANQFFFRCLARNGSRTGTKHSEDPGSVINPNSTLEQLSRVDIADFQ